MAYGMTQDAVSYTHLDVYKRQVVEFVSDSDVVCEDVQTDVYKRQPSHWIQRIFGFSRLWSSFNYLVAPL